MKDIENPARRGFLTAVSVAGLNLAIEAIPALAQPAGERPKEGDLLVSIGSESTNALEPRDIPLGGPPLLAWPMDAADKTVRKDSRLNKILLLRLDPSTLVGTTKDRAAEGVVAYSAICPHAGCERNVREAAQQMIEPASATPVPGPMPEILRQYTPVTAARLKNPEDGNWLMFRRTFDGWGYSPLGEITPANVGRLQPVWSFATGQTEGHEAPPVVNNGVMFVATPGNQLLALEARTGKVLWRYKRPFPEDMTPLHPTSRGVGLYGDKVYFPAAEAVLVAIDVRTGKEARTATVEDYKNGYYLWRAPLAIDGKVLLGASGGELGARGFLAAFDAETGKELWKTYTVPAPGEPGSETWPAGGDHYKRGGASIWITGTYDPER